MGNRAILLLLLLVLCYEVTVAVGFYREEKENWRGEREETERDKEEDWFLFQDSKRVIKTDAWVMTVLRNSGGRIAYRAMHIGFITMEPRAVFIPQYIHSSFILFIRTEEGQRLHIICSIDPSESLGLGVFQVTTDEAREMMTRQQEGPIVFLGDSRAPRPSPWRKFLQLKEQDRLQHLKRMVKFQQPPNQEEEQMAWSWRNLLNSIFREENKKKM
ncbi:hypothetical protein NC652_002733 [Populus alba x Populus x berolinensis]|uniref:Uncharacterized protein n=2 Tax=Populus TaxID=3689 RepID=A0A4U5R2B1_POPAL|nr:hypothetical protein NC652_002733 [Populus alba x Populus x berolinensis]KAJ7012886.1 hypothetical protein NC653_002810 [Populus alba x Populus x berolinensis]TKS16177.1 hypothetical protein D5086_0000024700 [Populus alba]